MPRRIAFTTLALAALTGAATPACVLPAYDESPVPTPWSRTLGSIGPDAALAVAAAQRGQVVVAGRFGGYLSLDDDQTVLQPLEGGVDAFVARYDEYGAPLWSASLGEPGTDEVIGVAVAPDGQILLAGHHNATPVNLPTALGPQRAFVAALDGETGALLWQRTLVDAGAMWGVGLGAIAVDASGNALVTGTWAGDFTLDTGEHPFPANPSGFNAFLLSLTPDGALAWGRDIDDNEGAMGLAVTTDSDGEVLLTGYHLGSASLGGPQPAPDTSSPDAHLFVAKYSAENVYGWGLSFAADGETLGTAITVDSTDAVLVAGSVAGPLGLGAEPLTPADGRDALLLKLGPAGNLVWGALLDVNDGEGWEDFPSSLRVNADGELLLAGNAITSYDDGTGALVTDSDMFLARLAPATGAALSKARFGGDRPQFLGGLALTPERDVLLAGAFEENLDLGGGPLPKYGDLDIFVARVAPP